jgi:hypothetical protein
LELWKPVVSLKSLRFDLPCTYSLAMNVEMISLRQDKRT